jgi:hypothetical protein
MALVNAALMAGENVEERVVRRVFAATLDLVIHLDREMRRDTETGLRRQVMEVLAVVPSLHDDFSTGPIFARSRLDAPLEWTGALPPDDLVERIDRSLPASIRLRHILEGRVNVL